MPAYTSRVEARLFDKGMDEVVEKALLELDKFIKSSNILRESATLVIEDMGNQIKLNNTVVDHAICTMYNPSDEYSSYCFNGMMFDHSSGMFYLGNGRSDNFVPILDAKKFTEAVIKEHFGITTNISKKALDRYFQLVKLGSKTKPESMLHEIITKFASSQVHSTILETLLRGGSTGGNGSKVQNLKITPADYAKFTARYSKIAVQYIEMVIKTLSLLSLGPASVMNSLILMSRSAESVVKSDLFVNKIKMMTDSETHGLTQELSTNPIFNPTARTMLGELIDPSTKDKFTKSRTTEKDYDSMMKVLNAQDMTREVSSTIFNVAVNLPNTVELGDSKDYEFYLDYTKLLRATQVQKAMAAVANHAPTVDMVNQSLDSVINTSSDSVLDPSMVSINNKVTRIMIDFMNQFS